MKYIALWFACSLIAFGSLNADFAYSRHNQFSDLHCTWRDDSGILIGVSLFRPISLLAAELVTNFNQHGWTLSTAD